jgi:hypothetical protein
MHVILVVHALNTSSILFLQLKDKTLLELLINNTTGKLSVFSFPITKQYQWTYFKEKLTALKKIDNSKLHNMKEHHYYQSISQKSA